MTRLKCKTHGILETLTYKGPSGTDYQFNNGQATDVQNHEDALSFLSANNGSSFEIDAPAKDVKALFESIKAGVAEVFKVRAEVAKADADAAVVTDIQAAAASGDRHGLSDDEYHAALADGTVGDVEKLLGEKDDAKGRSAFAKWAKTEFGIKLSSTKTTLPLMGVAFWAAYKALPNA